MRRGVLLLVLTATVAAGCSPNAGPPLPEPTAVKGSIALPGGQPLKGGRVVLNPKDQGGVEAFGDVKPDGTFTLTTYKPGDGAVPGNYVVTISPFNYAHKSGSPTKAPEAAHVPAKYLDAKSSDLTVEVKPGDNTLTLSLKR